MEEDGILDAHHNTLRAWCLLLLLILASCSYRIVVLHDPLSAEEHVSLGMSYEEKGEYDAALRQYELATDELPLAYLYMSNTFYAMGQYERAEKHYKKAISKTGSPAAMNNLAWLYYERGIRLSRAEKLAERAVSLAPDSDEYRDTLEKIRQRLVEGE